VISALASFHGRTLATVTATGQPRYQQNFDPLVPGFHHVPFNDLRGAREAWSRRLDREARTVAAILLEPLQGEGGIRPGDSPTTLSGSAIAVRRARDLADVR
jgi:acetylornithine/N-succinyldiaminopimelate aminotransferase